jgi:hypothetical protein
VVIEEAASGQALSVVDFEVRGARRDGMRACYGALMREMEIASISEGKLRPQVLQPCSAKALARPELDARAMLIDARDSDASTLLGIERLAGDPRFSCAQAAFETVHVATRRLSAYRDLDSCERARGALTGSMARAEKDALGTARGWLDEAIVEQQGLVESSCADDPDGDSCRRHQELVAKLERRRDGLLRLQDEPRSEIRLDCRGSR